jgi:hypothetical protein
MKARIYLVAVLLASAALSGQALPSEPRQIVIRNRDDVCASITPTSQSVVTAGAQHSVTVSILYSPCSWVTTETASWITIDSGSSGSGAGTVTYTASANSGSERVAVIDIGGRLLTVTQAAGGGVAAASCSSTHVQAAINTATDGQTVTVPAGSCTWTTTVTIPDTKGVSLVGNGIGSTIITDNYATDSILIVSLDSGNSLVRISGFTLNANAIDKPGNDANMYIQGEGANAFRVDHVYFQAVAERGIWVQPGSANELSGVIDHNTFECPDATCQSVAIGAANPGHEQFTRAYNPSGSDFIFLEDNEFNYLAQNDGGVEGYAGPRYVLRFNELHGVTQGHHGPDSGSRRGVHSFHIYRNTFDQVGCTECSGSERHHHFRSGIGFVFDNTYSWNGRNVVDYLRAYGSWAPWGQCDGTTAFDENQSGQGGYACLDQEGHLFTDDPDGDNGANTLHPLYSFGNLEIGVQTDLEYVLSPSALLTARVAENRDFYNQDATFDGTTGVGVGTLASRPSTCTTNVGYWATDQGSWNANGADGVFYRCTSTNTWTLYYTPYTYPHPLVTP